MVRLLKTSTAVVATFAAFATAASASGDAAKGKELFSQCAVCHTTAKDGGNRIGPNLFGVVGRKAGTAPGFNYSTAMKNSGLTWNDENLAHYLMKPSAVVPGNKMPFAGLSDSQKADDVVAYLETLK